MTKVFLRTPYNYDTMEASDASGLSTPEPSLAQQHMKDECDINTILRKFSITGQLPENVRMPQYGDFVDAMDYQSSLNAIKAAQESFMQLPADIRTRFDNDAGAFVDFCSNAENYEEASRLGLVPPKAQAVPDPAPEGGGVAQSST